MSGYFDADSGDLRRVAWRIAGLGFWRVDLASGTVFLSRETAAIHGLPDAVRLSLEAAGAYCAPEYMPRIYAAFRRCASDAVPYDETLELIREDGKRIWVRAIGEAERDAAGKIIGVRGAFQDISELAEVRQQAATLAEQLQQTLESISDAFFTLDHEWRFTFLNPQAERLFNRRRDLLLGQTIWDEYPAARGTPFQRQYERAIETRTTVWFTETYGTPPRWFEVSAYPVASGLAVYLREVTTAVEQRERLRLLETAVQRQNDVLMITDAQSLDEPDGPKIVYVNDAFVRMTGYSREEIIGRTPRILQGAGTDRETLDRVRRALEAREPVRAELLNYTRAGDEFFTEVDIVPLADNAGHTTHFVSVQRDISERKRHDEAARVVEERFEIIAKATNDVVWDWDLSTGSVWWNEALTDVFGFDGVRRDLGPDWWAERIHPEDRQRVVRGMHRAVDHGSTHWSDEYRVLKANGAVATVIARGYVIRDDSGRAVRMIGTLLDVTDRREIDERLRQSQRLEAVGQLTGGIAHDFNNLLTVILGNAELLCEQLEDHAEMRGLAELTVSAAERGAELTSRLLAFARRQPLQPLIVDLNSVIAGMDPMLRRTVTEDIAIEWIYAPQLWRVEVDRGQFESALLNLALNARDAMRERGGRLTIQTANVAFDDGDAAREDIDAGQYVEVAVSDTGEGMTAATVGRAFEPFFTTKASWRGSGLGLSMVYGFVKQSGGHAKIYSEPGEGTVVRLYFPRAAGELDAAAQPDERLVGGRESILVVEDDEMVRAHVTAQLADLGYRVLSASSGPEALEVLKADAPIDLLFTDVIMPGGMNGRELATAAQVLRPDLRVLFTSGYTESAIVHQGRLDPGVQLLSKPYRRQELAARVRQVLDSPPSGPEEDSNAGSE